VKLLHFVYNCELFFLFQRHPELDTTNISIADVIMRCSTSRKPRM